MFRSPLFRTISITLLLVALVLFILWPWLVKVGHPRDQKVYVPAQQK